MKKYKSITNIDQITAEWFTNMLHNRGYIRNGKVMEIVKRKSRETMESKVYFLDLIFSKDAELKYI